MAEHEKIADGVYRVGERESAGSIECNPYLIIENGEGVLLDPGSVLDFDRVLQQVTALIPLDTISLVIAHHQDPDLCGSIALFSGRAWLLPSPSTGGRGLSSNTTA